MAIVQWDLDAVRADGLLVGFHTSTWVVVAVQVGGALLTAFVIKFAGNVLKTFATVLALLCTCMASMLLFDFQPTGLFGVGVGLTATSIWLYASPSLMAYRRPLEETSAAETCTREPLIGSPSSARACRRPTDSDSDGDRSP